MIEELTQFDRLLLDELQAGLPLVERPFGQLAAKLGSTEAAVIERVAEWSGPEGLIREISGLFDAAAMGYQSTLVGMAVPADGLDRAGQVVSEHPGVSHCYGREGRLNLWLTLALPPDSRLGIEGTLAVLARQAGATAAHSFPVLRRFKLDARMGMAGEIGDTILISPGRVPAERSQVASSACGGTGDTARGVSPAPIQSGVAAAALHRKAVAALQTPLPAVREPFEVIAGPAGMSAEDLLAMARDFLAWGWLRRYAAVLRHRQAGAAVNVMVVWQVPAGQEEAFGQLAAGLPEVSHCYQRPPAEGWPYNLYTMLHGRSAGQVEAAIARLAAACHPHLALPTLKEYAKRRVRLFSPDLARWEDSAAAGPGFAAETQSRGEEEI